MSSPDTVAVWRRAEEIANSAAVIGVYAAPEWDELSIDGKAWVAAIVKEMMSREQALEKALRLTKRALDVVALWDSTVADCIPDKLATTIRDARTSAAALLTPEQPAPPPVFVRSEG